MSKNITSWLIKGNVGSSSKAMASVALGIDPEWISEPRDSSDLHRCLLLLDQAPEVRNHFSEIAELSEDWRSLIDRWDEVESLFIEEAGLNWSKSTRATKTYQLMRSIRGEAGKEGA